MKHLSAQKKYAGYESIRVKLTDLYFNGRPSAEAVKITAYFERQHVIWKNIDERGLENPIITWLDEEGRYIGPPGARLAYAFLRGYDSIDAILIQGTDEERDEAIRNLAEEHRKTETYLIDKKYWEKDFDVLL